MLSYKKIIAAIDGEFDSKEIARRAMQLADLSRGQVELLHVLANVYFPSSAELYAYDIPKQYEQNMLEYAQKKMLGMAEELALSNENIVLLKGQIAEEIKNYTQENETDLLVLGAHKKEGIGSYFGSNANRILHHAKTDILMANTVKKDKGIQSYEKIIIAVDFIPEIEKVIKHACSLADAYGAAIEMVYVIEGPLGLDIPSEDYKHHLQEKAEWQFKQLKSTYQLETVKSQVLVGSPAVKISEYARKHGGDLIITGSHGRHGIGLLLGSVTNSLFHKADCDVLAVSIAS